MTGATLSMPGRPAPAALPAARAPAIYAVHPELPRFPDRLGAWLDHAVGMGFGQVLLPAPAPEGVALADIDPADFAAACRTRGLVPLLDVVLDRVAAGSAEATAAPLVFRPADLSAPPDPRGVVESGEWATARLETDVDTDAFATWWSERLVALQAAGIGGFRLLGLARLPSWRLPAVVRALRRACPEASLIGWTPGTDLNAAPALAGAGLDHVVPSLPWWDWRSDWLWQETTQLRRAAPLLGCADVPGAPRIAAAVREPALLERTVRRALMLAATLADGWMMPMGMEFCLIEPRPDQEPMDARLAGHDLSECAAALNRARRRTPALDAAAPPLPLTGPGGPVLALLRHDAADLRRAGSGALLLANVSLEQRRKLAPSHVLPAAGGVFGRFEPLVPHGPALTPGEELVLAPGEARLYVAEAVAPRTERPEDAPPLRPEDALDAARWPRIGIEDPTPRVDGGPFAVKRIAGESVAVEADLICDGHDKLAAALFWRGPGEAEWQQTRMRPMGNDRWTASLPLRTLGLHEYTVEAWRDAFASFRDELAKKHAAGVPIHLELEEGRLLVAHAASAAPGEVRPEVQALLDALTDADDSRRRQILLAEATAELMARADDRPFSVRLETPLLIEAERAGAAFASWYEVFPRSLSDDPDRHGTFDDVIRHMPRVRAMGFDVLYFPPIHPIGRINRKGRNNSLRAQPSDPGSPYAIGAEEGGHTAIHPQLGSIEDFRRMVAAAAEHGLEIALDFAVQCAPDHPWLKQHKEWFDWRPDGSLRYAENPPKKYEDIVNVDFYRQGAVPDLWIALCDAVLFWCGHGVRIFRVDNPHTKPLPFWQWLIAEVRRRYPDTIFLAEAFTRPKLMYRLGKIGFTQSYTYFTWRNTKAELREYLEELTTTAPKEFYRPHFFVNTPDINPIFLQGSGRPGFLIRAALAATLSGLWGVYNGFELCEGRPVPGKEEYLDSEKYEIKKWDWDRPGNIVPEITQLNRIRALNPALHTHLGVRFHNAFNDAILYFEKATPDRSNVLLVAVSMDPRYPQEAAFEIPLWEWGLPDDGALAAEDLLTGATLTWRGKTQRMRLTPAAPYAIWRVRPAGTESER